MTYKHRIFADRVLAAPVALFFNLMARCLGALLRRDHSITPANVRQIMIAKLVGMGSAIQATPLLIHLKRHFPNARITFVTLGSNRVLIERLAGVDEVLCLDDRSSLRLAWSTLTTILALIRRRGDLYFDLEIYSAFASLLTLWAVTRNRIGFYRHSTIFKNGIYTHLVYFNTHMSVRLLYLQLGRVVGMPAPVEDSPELIRVDEADRASLQAKLIACANWHSGRPYLIVNPNASELLLERRWPADYVVQTVSRLVALGHQVAFIGSRGEQPYCAQLCDRLSPDTRQHVLNTAGLLSIGELLVFLQGAACVLTNDSGPMHMAIALRTPTVCLFGPVTPEHYGHINPHVATLYAPVFCSPCVHEIDPPPCNGDNICMQRLTPDLTLAAIDDLLSATEPPPGNGRMVRLIMATDQANGRPLGLVARASIGDMPHTAERTIAKEAR